MRPDILALLTVLLSHPATAAESEAPLQLLNQPQTAPQDQVQLPASLHDIYPPVTLPEPFPWLPFTLIAAAVLLAAAGLYWWLVKRPKPLPPPIPPGIIARDSLMRAKEFMNQEQALLYMEQVSEILRTYIEARFKLPSSRQTTRELFRELSRNTAQYEQLSQFRPELRSCLELCDLAKFAHQSAGIELLEDMEKRVLNFVNTTESEPEQGGH